MLVSRSSRTVRAGLFGLALAVLVLMVPVEVSAQSFIERLQNTVEIMIGLSTKEHVFREYGRPVQYETELHSQVREIFSDLVWYAQRNIEYELNIIDSPVINAFAAPGGFVFVTTGLLWFVEHDPDIIAGVLGHEIAHVEKKHGMDELTRRYGFTLLQNIFLSNSSQDARLVAEIASELIHLGYSREAEHEADEVGLLLAAEAGYDPNGIVRFLNKPQAVSGPEIALLEFISTHPLTSGRIERTQGKIAELWPTKDALVKWRVDKIVEIIRTTSNEIYAALHSARLDDSGPAVIPHLIDYITDEAWVATCQIESCRDVLITALPEMGPEALTTLPTLRQLLNHHHQPTADTAAIAIRLIVERNLDYLYANEAVPALLDIVANSRVDSYFREWSVELLYEIEPLTLIAVTRSIGDGGAESVSEEELRIAADYTVPSVHPAGRQDWFTLRFTSEQPWEHRWVEIMPDLPDPETGKNPGYTAMLSDLNLSVRWDYTESRSSAAAHYFSSFAPAVTEWDESLFIPWFDPGTAYFGGVYHRVQPSQTGGKTYSYRANNMSFYQLFYDEHGILRDVCAFHDGMTYSITNVVFMPGTISVQDACSMSTPEESRFLYYTNNSTVPVDLSGVMTALRNSMTLRLWDGLVLEPGQTLGLTTHMESDRLPFLDTIIGVHDSVDPWCGAWLDADAKNVSDPIFSILDSNGDPLLPAPRAGQ